MTNVLLTPVQFRALRALLPLLPTEQERTSLLMEAFGPDFPLLSRIDFTKDAATFNTHLLDRLLEYGRDASGEHACWTFLLAIRERVGVDKQAKIDALHEIFLPRTDTPESSPEPEPEQTAAPVRRATTATINVLNAPPDARFFVGEDVFDLSPVVVSFRRGESVKQIVVCVTCDGYFDEEFEITLRRGDTIEISVSPTARPRAAKSIETDTLSHTIFRSATEDVPPFDFGQFQIEEKPQQTHSENGFSDGHRITNPMDGANMIWIPAGDFVMGSHEGNQDAQPPHVVHLDGFYIYETPVTRWQYMRFCTATNYMHPDSNLAFFPNCPITNVTWFDAMAYAMWAGVSLPAEAQWEKAARGTDERRFPWGNEWNSQLCHSSVVSPAIGPVNVGSFPGGASPYGILDMAGNVSEWCFDAHQMDFYVNSPRHNPLNNSNWPFRVTRGGSFGFNQVNALRTYERFWCAQTFLFPFVGFRCVRALTP